MSDCVFFLSVGHYEDLKHSKEELEISLKRYRKCTSALKDENERLKDYTIITLFTISVCAYQIRLQELEHHNWLKYLNILVHSSADSLIVLCE